MTVAFRRLGLICGGLIVTAWAASLGLRCPLLAAIVTAASMGTGALCGLFLGLVTRARRPVLIYLFLIMAGLMLWPLYSAWPYADGLDIPAWPGAPGFVFEYFSVLRPLVFLLALPVPFAVVGQHGPDPLPVSSSEPTPPAPVLPAQVSQTQERQNAQNEETETR